MKKIGLLTPALVALSLLLADCSGSKTTALDGAGATFPLPFYSEAFKLYQSNSGIQVNYGAVGSGGGIRSLKDEVVDFAASDAFLTDQEISEMPRDVIHVPTCMGAVVLAYNCPEIDTLRLTGALIADIYLGKITRWDDPAIAAANPSATLPAKAITPVYRSDGSGTTNVFSDYLCKVSSQWAAEIGSGKSLKWVTGMAAKGNPGVAGVIAETDGSIGYVGSEYSFSLNIPTAQLQNQAGRFVAPTIESISAAAAGQVAPDTRQMITNAAGDEAYPISCLTWLIAYQDLKYASQTEQDAVETARLLEWMISPEAQKIAPVIHFAPLSDDMIKAAKDQLSKLTYDGKPIKEIEARLQK